MIDDSDGIYRRQGRIVALELYDSKSVCNFRRGGVMVTRTAQKYYSVLEKNRSLLDVGPWRCLGHL